MRFHTTLQDITISVLVLICCALLSLYGMVYFDMDNPTQLVANVLIDALESEERSFTFTARLERTFLKQISFTDPSASFDNWITFEAESMRMNGGLLQLVASLLFHDEMLQVELSNATAKLDLAQRDTDTAPSSSTYAKLPSWIEKNSFRVQADALNLYLHDTDLSVSMHDGSSTLLLERGRTMPSLHAKFAHSSLLYRSNELNLQEIQFNLDAQGTATLISGQTDFKNRDISLAMNSFIGQTSVKSLDISDQELTLAFSLTSLDFEANSDMRAQVPNVSADLFIRNMQLSSFTLSYDSLSASSKDILITSPPATFVGTLQALDLSLILATKEQDTVLLAFTNGLQFVSDTVLAKISFTDQSLISADISLGTITYAEPDLTVKANDIRLFLDAELDDFSVHQANARLQGYGSLFHQQSLISVSSALNATFSYGALDQALSTSLLLDFLETNITKEAFSARLSFQSNPQGRQLQGELQLDQRMLLRSVYDFSQHQEDTLFVSSRFEQFPLDVLSPALDRYAPFLQPYYDEATNLIGNLTFQSVGSGAKVLPFDGKLSVDLALLSAKIGDFSLDGGFTLLSDIAQDVVTVDSMTLATSGLRLEYAGLTNLNDWLPSGNLKLFKTDDGQMLGQVDFIDEPPSAYRIHLTTPLEESLFLDSLVKMPSRAVLSGEGTFLIFQKEYPFDFSLDTSTLTLVVQQEKQLALSTNLAPPVMGSLQLNSFEFPQKGFFSDSVFTGDLFFSFNHSRNWRLVSDSLDIQNVGFQGKKYDLSTSLYIDEDSIDLPSMLLSEEDFTATGSLAYKGTDFINLYQSRLLAPFRASFLLMHQDEKKIALSLEGNNDRITSVLLLNSLPLDRFHQDASGVIVDFSALGFTDLKDALSVDGVLALEKDTLKLSTKLSIENTNLRLFDSFFTAGAYRYDGTLLEIFSGGFSSKGRFEHVRPLSYVDQLSHVSYSIAGKLDFFDSFLSFPSVLKPILDKKVSLSLSVSDILLFSERGFSDADFDISLDYPSLRIGGDTLNLAYDMNSHFIQGALQKEFGIGLSIEGTLDTDDLALSIKDIYVPLPLINRTFLKPIFAFLDGVAEGQVFMVGQSPAIRTYGQLSVDSSRMELFWLAQDIITMKNFTATLDGNRAISPRFPFFSTNTRTGKTVQGYGSALAQFDGLKLEHYEISAESGDEKLYVWIPMQGLDADIRTYAGGTFHLYGIGFETWLSGEVVIQDTSLTLGIKDLPYWYVANNLTSTNFRVTTAKNVGFFYPNTPNPFIRATIAENQRINFTFDHITDEFAIDGNFSFRSGELYYFQKNFFITEGSLSLHTDALFGRSQIQPSINLRAKLTDFDSQGNRVDIFLVLRESSLNNLNPQFESIPSKDMNEILEILGQSILPSGAYGQVNLFSVASLAAAATDVAERLGYLDTSQTTLLTESIRISLGLDMFSLRSNILQNILFDALPGSNLGSTLSPIARYLNNTSIFMGKYVGRQFFLQALLHLTAMDRSKVRRSFISPDLSLDLELSLDWANPIGTFSFFTQPNELSFTNILDTIGFSVTRRIVLR